MLSAYIFRNLGCCLNTPFITHWTIKMAGNQSKTSRTKIRPTCLARQGMTSKIGSKMAQNWQNGYIIQTKRARMLIFVAIPPFSYPGSSIMAFSGTYNNSLPKILGLGVPKQAPKWPKIGKIAILSKPRELGCWFLWLYPHFPILGVQ